MKHHLTQKEFCLRQCQALAMLDRIWRSLYLQPMPTLDRLNVATILRSCQQRVVNDTIDVFNANGWR